jgi:hypothetical protein
MSKNLITSERSQLQLGLNPLDIESFFYLLKSTNVCPNGRHSLLLRTPDSVSEPVLLATVTNVSQSDNCLEIDLSDPTLKHTATISITADDNGIKFNSKFKSPKPIWLVEWKISGLHLEEVLVPALGGQSIKSNTPHGTLLSYKYPFWWNAQFVLGKINGGGIIINSKDEKPELKLLRVLKEKETFEITYGFEVPAPLDKTTFEAEWYIDFYNGDWKNGVDIHREWLEKAFQLKPYKNHPNFPDWALVISISH